MGLALALTGCFTKPDPICPVKADLAYSVAQARDRGDTLTDTLGRVTAQGSVGSDQRQIIAQVYNSRHVAPDRIYEIFLAKCL